MLFRNIGTYLHVVTTKNITIRGFKYSLCTLTYVDPENGGMFLQRFQNVTAENSKIGTHKQHLYLYFTSFLNIEAVRSSETSVCPYVIIQWHNREHDTLNRNAVLLPLRHLNSTLKTEVAYFSETLISTYKTR
jgi:hypothetical protein